MCESFHARPWERRPLIRTADRRRGAWHYREPFLRDKIRCGGEKTRPKRTDSMFRSVIPMAMETRSCSRFTMGAISEATCNRRGGHVVIHLSRYLIDVGRLDRKEDHVALVDNFCVVESCQQAEGLGSSSCEQIKLPCTGRAEQSPISVNSLLYSRG